MTSSIRAGYEAANLPDKPSKRTPKTGPTTGLPSVVPSKSTAIATLAKTKARLAARRPAKPPALTLKAYQDDKAIKRSRLVSEQSELEARFKDLRDRYMEVRTLLAALDASDAAVQAPVPLTPPSIEPHVDEDLLDAVAVELERQRQMRELNGEH